MKLLHFENVKMLDAFIKLSEGNAVIKAFLSALDSCNGIDFNSYYTNRLVKMRDEDQRFWRCTVEMIQIVVRECERNGLPLLTIKSFLPYPFADSNVDVVAVDSDNIMAYRALLNRLGFYKLTKHMNRTDFREPKKRLYRYNPDRLTNAQCPLLHLHRAISWNGIDYLDSKSVWDRRRSHKVEDLDIPIPSSEDEALIMAAHSIFENKYITIGELIHLSTLVSDGFDWDYAIRHTEIYHWLPALLLWLKTVNSLCNILDIRVEIPEWVYDRVSVKKSSTLYLSDSGQFPYVYPLMSIARVLFNKLILDLIKGNLKQLPRQLFSYSIVDLIWAYRNALRKRFKSNVLFDRWGMQ